MTQTFLQKIFSPFLFVYVLIAPCIQPVEVVLNLPGQSNGCQSQVTIGSHTLAGYVGDWLNS